MQNNQANNAMCTRPSFLEADVQLTPAVMPSTMRHPQPAATPDGAVA